MKKILKAIALIVCLVFPLSAMAMSSIGDSELSAVTGQSGVSINLDVSMDLAIGTIAWGDSDGVVAHDAYGNSSAGVTSGDNSIGWVGLKNLAVQGLRIRLRDDVLQRAFVGALDAPTSGPYTSTFAPIVPFNGTAIGAIVQNVNLNIVQTNQALVAPGNGASGILQNFMSVSSISNADLVTNLSLHAGFLANDYTTWTASDATKLSTYFAASGNPMGITTLLDGIAKGKGVLTLLEGQKSLVEAWIGIKDGKGDGAAVWADSAAASAAVLPLTIDVATGVGTAPGQHGNHVTFVRIGLGTIGIEMASLSADVKLGNTDALEGNTLGSLYLGNMVADLNGVTSYVDIYQTNPGQQGVTIYTNIKFDSFSFGELAWGDKDGYNSSSPGWVGLKHLVINDLEITGPVSISVATATSGSLNGTTYVQIGFSDHNSSSGLVVGIGSLSATVALGSSHGSWSGSTFTSGLTQELGDLYLSDMNLTLTGYVQIGTRTNGTQGVTINLGTLGIAISSFTVSWGDTDGYSTDSKGYVGLVNATLTGLALTGQVTIDVATVNTNATPGNALALMYAAYPTSGMGALSNGLAGTATSTFVHIGLGGGTPLAANLDGSYNPVTGALGISVGSFTADVTMGNNQALVTNSGLSYNAQTLGSIYASGVKVGMSGWVDIAAH